MKREVLSIVWCGVFLAGLNLTAMANDIEDKDITNHVETQFRLDDAVPHHNINVRTNQGIVTLTGSVDNILAKDRAQHIVEATVGVRAVINRISVISPITRTDSVIKTAVERALLMNPATDALQIDASVNTGVVTLTGTVGSWQEKQLAGTVVKGVRGVLDVTNTISVNYAMETTDHKIQNIVQQRLKNDVRVDDALIHVEVDDGEIRLTGTVGSLQEKNRAQMTAWVGGVTSVDAEGLKIQWWARDEMRRETLYDARSTEEIEEAVKDAFSYDPRIIAHNIDVDVSPAGIVTLSGVVESLQTRNAAEQNADNTMGVRRVINNIKIRPVEVPDDDELKDRISGAFLEDPYIDRFDLNISVSRGTVYLSGQVNTSWEKNRAGSVATGVRGVLSVVNNIDFEHQWVWKPDWQIQQDVKKQLRWSPFVDEDKVSVTVDNGVVTLSGLVDTYSERQTAEDNAYQGGAKDVKNNLSVRLEHFGPYFHGAYPYLSPYFGSYILIQGAFLAEGHFRPFAFMIS